MNGLDLAEFRKKMTAPFTAAEIEWKIQVVTKDKKSALAVPYIDSRAIQNRLDEVVGPMNWRSEFREWKDKAQICGISIWDAEKGDWNVKWDGADDTDIESTKGGLSDSFKRAATHWGIGRYLYSLDGAWVPIADRGNGKPRIADGQEGKLNAHYETQLKHYLQGSKPPVQADASTAAQDQTPKYYRIQSIQSNNSHCLLALQSTTGETQNVYAQLNPLFGVNVILEDIEVEVKNEGGAKINFMKRYKFYEQAAA